MIFPLFKEHFSTLILIFNLLSNTDTENNYDATYFLLKLITKKPKIGEAYFKNHPQNMTRNIHDI